MLYFLVYNDGTHDSYLNKLLHSVKTYGAEFKIIIFDKKSIDKEFLTKHDDILKCHRGGGYWLWKSYIINETLKTINDGDIVFYLDSTYYFIDNFTDFCFDSLKTSDFVVWKNKPNESTYYMKNWCKMDVITKFNMFDTVFTNNAEDCWGGALLIKKTGKTVEYIKEWLDICCDYENISDYPSKLPNSSLFQEHRHDQSLLSIIIHKYNISMRIFERKYLQNARVPF